MFELKKLLHASPDYGIDAKTQDRHGYSFLMLAVKFSKLSVVELLLKHGADINAKDKEGHTALYHAKQNASHIHKDVVEFLLKHGATE